LHVTLQTHAKTILTDACKPFEIGRNLLSPASTVARDPRDTSPGLDNVSSITHYWTRKGWWRGRTA